MAEETADGTDLAPERVSELIGSDEADLVDVRQDYEWEAGRIGGARHIEMNDLSSQAESIPRHRPVVFYCRSGNRSGTAAEVFREAGYDAYNLDGGLVAWEERGLPLDPPDGTVAEMRPAPQ